METGDIDDQLFPLHGVVDLFVALRSTDKRLHVIVGAHRDAPPDEDQNTIRFLARRLGAA